MLPSASATDRRLGLHARASRMPQNTRGQNAVRHVTEVPVMAMSERCHRIASSTTPTRSPVKPAVGDSQEVDPTGRRKTGAPAHPASVDLRPGRFAETPLPPPGPTESELDRTYRTAFSAVDAISAALSPQVESTWSRQAPVQGVCSPAAATAFASCSSARRDGEPASVVNTNSLISGSPGNVSVS